MVTQKTNNLLIPSFCKTLIAVICPIIAQISHAELITFDWATGHHDDIPTTTFFNVDGSGLDVKVDFTTLSQGNAANNPRRHGGIENSAGSFLDRYNNLSMITFERSVIVSQFYWRPQAASETSPVTLSGKLEGVQQWSISSSNPSIHQFILIYSDYQLASGSLSNPIDTITFSQTALSNANRLDDITFTVEGIGNVARIPEPKTSVALASFSCFLAVLGWSSLLRRSESRLSP